jgi:hypothetical protein
MRGFLPGRVAPTPALFFMVLSENAATPAGTDAEKEFCEKT